MHPGIATLLGLLAASGLLARPASAQATFQVLNGGSASNMTPDGQTVVGSDTRGVWLWTRSGGQIHIGGTWGLDLSDDTSVVVGNTDDSTGIDGPAMWNRANGWQTLGGLPGGTPTGGSWGWTSAVSGDGSVIVGRAFHSDGKLRGFRWDALTGMVALPQSFPGFSIAHAISADGLWIGGLGEIPGVGWRAVLWDASLNQTLPLVRPENPLGFGGIHDINSDGTVFVGFESTNMGHGPAAGFLWKAGQGVLNFGPVPGTGPPFESSSATATSEDGSVVGGLVGSTILQESRATLWTQATGVLVLQDYLMALGVQGLDQVRLAYVTDISADGTTIIGWGTRASSTFPTSFAWWRATIPICSGGAVGFCTTSPNSAGSGARIGSNGRVSLAANSFELSVTGLPPETLGSFHYGPQRQQVPFGNGTLCVAAGATGLARLPVFQADTGGRATTQLDFCNLPPTGQIVPGSTWYFQAWYRDPNGSGTAFNLSDGLRATFCD